MTSARDPVRCQASATAIAAGMTPLAATPQDASVTPAPGSLHVIRLSHDEALMLFEILHRWEEQGQVAEPEHHAGQMALWKLPCLLEVSSQRCSIPRGRAVRARAWPWG